MVTYSVFLQSEKNEPDPVEIDAEGYQSFF
jgi:hypothetical protein